MVISPIHPEQIDELVKLEGLCFDKPWGRRLLLDELSHEESICLGYNVDNTLIAANLMRVIGEELWIMHIMVHKEWRKTGLATKLLHAGFDYAKKLGLSNSWLEVEEQNYPAIKVYEANGFNVVGRRKHYYPPAAPGLERLNALVMCADMKLSNVSLNH